MLQILGGDKPRHYTVSKLARATVGYTIFRLIRSNIIKSVPMREYGVDLGPGITLHTLPAAHEQLAVNSRGKHDFWGYIVRLGDIRIYHSGDCVPYEGLEAHLRNLKPDVALLPVNGRDDYRLSRNIVITILTPNPVSGI